MGFPNPDGTAAVPPGLVPEPEAVSAPALALRLRKSDPSAVPFACLRITKSGKGAPQVDCGPLENLRRHVLPPRQPGDMLGDHPIPGDDEDSAGILTSLPCIESLDEVEAGPGNGNRRIAFSLTQGVGQQSQTLVIGIPGCSRMTRQHLLLRHRGINGESECRVTHVAGTVMGACDKPGCGQRVRCRRLRVSGRRGWRPPPSRRPPA
jgi:hypothetical protein